jgi:phosphoribosylformylglycinamidine cyclo-ligase
MESAERPTPLSYAATGVQDLTADGSALGGLLAAVRRTFSLAPPAGKPLLPLGYFANVLDLGDGLGLAISTDGVGTKLLVAQLIGKYDTVGIDCVAMNVNDVLCVGAEPLAMTDYVAGQTADADLLTELGKGLLRGAELAHVSIPGGELAQVREIVQGAREGAGFDLVGTCVGLVPVDQIRIGADIVEGDVLIGLASSGIHSNGLTLARRVLLDQAGLKLADTVPEFGRTLGEELLEPTTLYVDVVLAALRARLPVKALMHVTGGGFFNLTRVAVPAGMVITELLDVPPVFQLIQRLGGLFDEEMFRVFNMGLGFCLVAPAESADAIVAIAERCGHRGKVIGHASHDPERTLTIVPRRLRGKDGLLRRY